MAKTPMEPWKRLYLAGLLKSRGKYMIEGKEEQIFGGDELMNAGMVISDQDLCADGGDYSSAVFSSCGRSERYLI